MEETIQKIKPNLEKSVEKLKQELAGLRIGRATGILVEDLIVDYYGTKSPLKQMAAISVPDSRTIVIEPWTHDHLVNIEKTINNSDLGLNPNNDGKVIRLVIPPLTEERRQELVKILHQKTEEARISIRNLREDVWEEIQNLEKDGKISEDDKFRGKDDLQKLINEYNEKVKEISEQKEKEIKTV
jgi:ribosome recycling factor